jgi:membrane protein
MLLFTSLKFFAKSFVKSCVQFVVTSGFLPYLVSLPNLQWQRVGRSLWQRFTQDRLSLVASSLTFTTVMAVVPLLAVALAVFSAHPLFADLRSVLQQWLIDSLVPDAIARQVMGALTQFTSKAHRLGFAGFVVLIGSSLALVLTIDHTLNTIWRVQQKRKLWKRLLIYSMLLAFGPLLLAVSLALTTKVAMWSQSVVGLSAVRWFYSGLEFMLVWSGLTVLYRFVPNTTVWTRHALLGGLFAAGMLEMAKKLLTIYLMKMPAYSMIYGAFATVPVLLIWTYVAWLLVLLGAEIAASLAELRTE